VREYGNAISCTPGMYSMAEIIGILRWDCEKTSEQVPEMVGQPAIIMRGPETLEWESYEEVWDEEEGDTHWVGVGDIIGVKEQWGWYVVVWEEGEEPFEITHPVGKPDWHVGNVEVT
jgi:hypothetical protein